MKIVSEMPLRDFKFWSGAKDTAAELTNDQLDQLEEMLEDTNPDGMTDTQINDFFWFERDTIYEWLGLSDYPKWCVFKSKLNNNRVVYISDEDAEYELERMLKRYDVEADWHENGDEPSFNDVTGHNLDASDSDEFEEWLWEEDNGLEYLLYLPRDWAAAFENADLIGFDDEEEKIFNKFLEDYKDELNSTSDYFYIWDTEHIEFRTCPDYGETGDCCTLRIYSYNK